MLSRFDLKNRVLPILILLTIFLACSSSSNESSADNSGLYRENQLRTGQCDTRPVEEYGRLEWIFKAGERFLSSPLVHGNLIYLNSSKGKLWAVDKNSGNVAWTHSSKPSRFREEISTPCISDGKIFFGSGDSAFVALDSKTGQKIWEYMGEDRFASSPIAADDLIIVGCNDEHLYAFSSADGSIKWKFKCPSSIYCAPAVWDSMVVFNDSDDSLYAVNCRTGEHIWSHGLRKLYCASPLIADSSIIVINRYSVLNRISMDGRLLLEKDYDSGTRALPAFKDSVIYYHRNYIMVAYDIKNNRNIWEFDAPGSFESSPTIAGEYIYFGCDNGCLYALNSIDGNLAWKFCQASAINTAPQVHDGMVYMVSKDGILYAISSESDEKLANPDATMDNFIIYSKKGDLQGLLSCMSPISKEYSDLKRAIDEMDDKQLSEMVSSLKDYSLNSNMRIEKRKSIGPNEVEMLLVSKRGNESEKRLWHVLQLEGKEWRIVDTHY